MQVEIDRNVLIKRMAYNLAVFRAKLGITQIQLAHIVGLTRQTISAIESGQREMSWTVFLSLILFFWRNQSTKRLLVAFEIYTPSLDSYLNVAKN
jgi:DNA-binding XRE family transcriptional regulator